MAVDQDNKSPVQGAETETWFHPESVRTHVHAGCLRGIRVELAARYYAYAAAAPCVWGLGLF